VCRIGIHVIRGSDIINSSICSNSSDGSIDSDDKISSDDTCSRGSDSRYGTVGSEDMDDNVCNDRGICSVCSGRSVGSEGSNGSVGSVYSNDSVDSDGNMTLLLFHLHSAVYVDISIHNSGLIT
jgi:hypothetical protein